MVQCQSFCSAASTITALCSNVNWTSHPSNVSVCLCAFGTLSLVILCETLFLLHSSTLCVSQPLSLHYCNIWSIQSSPARVILYTFPPPPPRSLCVCCTYKAAKRKRTVKTERERKRESFLNLGVRVSPLSLPFFLSIIDLAVERRAKRGSGANRGKVSKPWRESERGRHK